MSFLKKYATIEVDALEPDSLQLRRDLEQTQGFDTLERWEPIDDWPWTETVDTESNENEHSAL